MQSLWTSLSALRASQAWLDRISENVANSDTAGYQAMEGSFADTLTAFLQPAATAPDVPGRHTPPGWRGGTGVRPTRESVDTAPGSLVQTGRETDLAVEGDAYFLVQGPDGLRVTRSGQFQWSRALGGGFVLTTPEGYPVLDTHGRPIRKPAGDAVTIAADGTVIGAAGGTAQRIALVRVPLAGEKLEPAGDTTYRVWAGGVELLNQAGVPADIKVVQGALNQSNVDLVGAMTELIRAQRQFDLNAEALQLTDRMMETANQIRSS